MIGIQKRVIEHDLPVSDAQGGAVLGKETVKTRSMWRWLAVRAL